MNERGAPHRNERTGVDLAVKEPASAQLLGTGSETPTPWAEARRRLEEAETYWVATVLPDGGPHVRPVIGLWLDSAFYFSSSERSRKGANLADSPHCVVTVGSLVLPALDLVVEGEGAKMSDEARLQRVADEYAAKYGWHVTVRDGALYGDGAPTAGPPPYVVIEVTPATIFGFPGVTGTDESGQGTEGFFSPTRWRF